MSVSPLDILKEVRVIIHPAVNLRVFAELERLAEEDGEDINEVAHSMLLIGLEQYLKSVGEWKEGG